VGSASAAGPVTLLSDMPDAADVVELERRVFCSAGGDTETASVIAEAAAGDALKLAWMVGRRMRKLWVALVGSDIFGGDFDEL
jgi:hypothetical protein